MSADSWVVIGHLPKGATAVALFAATVAYFHDPSLSLPVRPNQDEGQSWIEVLPAHDREFGVFAAARIEVPGSRLVEWARRVELLYRSRYVPVIGRFSHPPRIEDLQGLTLDDKDRFVAVSGFYHSEPSFFHHGDHPQADDRFVLDNKYFHELLAHPRHA